MEAGLQSTIDVRRAAETQWDAIVVGAGLAGCVAARALSQQGRRVLLVDKATFPRDKVCGACLNGDALAGLEAEGLGEMLRELDGRELHQYSLHSKHRQLDLSLPGGIAVSRAALDAALVRAAIAAGTHWLSSIAVRVGDADNSALRRSVRTLDGQAEFHAAVVVVASGLASQKQVDVPETESLPTKNSRIGLGSTALDFPDTYQPGVIYMAVGRGGYVGLVRTEGDRLNIAAAVDRPFLQSLSPRGAAESILRSAGLPFSDTMLVGPWQGTCPLTRRRRQAGSHRLFFVGDANGYVEPFTGEGMAWAIRSGRAVVGFAVNGMDAWQPELTSHWTLASRQLVGRHQWLCRCLSRVMRYPRLVSGMIRCGRVFPSIGHRVVRQLNEERRHDLLHHRPGHRAAV